jgi:hypothetical protein
MAADPLDPAAQLPDDLAAWLADNREAVLRRWLGMLVERTTIEELKARPIGQRLEELDLLLDAARGHGGQGTSTLDAELERRLAAGQPFALALFALPPSGDPAAWADAMGGPGEAMLAPDGRIAAIVEAAAPREARAAADRLRATAWQRVGGASALPDVGLALFPTDGTSAAELLDTARDELPWTSREELEATWAEPSEQGDDEPAPVTPLHRR